MFEIYVILTVCVFRSCLGETPNSPYSRTDLYDTYPDYGKTWMFFPDGEGRPRVMILEGEDEQPNLLRFGPELYVIFNLYTRENLNESYILQANDTENFEDSPFDPNKDVKFITHGWMSSGSSDTCVTIKDAFLRGEDLNVIIVDWEQIAGNRFYPVPASKTKEVGQYFSKMIDFLVERGSKTEKMHLVGHSLGAHISGIAAHFNKHGRIARITGLDPALPGFEFVAGLNDRLDAEDADFVDTIHTCAGVLGFFNELGHVDAYPNGGTPAQPGCCCLSEFTEACSHGRSWQFFAESVNSDVGFLAVKCKNWEEYKKKNCTGDPTKIGYPLSPNTRGTYYLETNGQFPFARGTIFSGAYDDDDEDESMQSFLRSFLYK